MVSLLAYVNGTLVQRGVDFVVVEVGGIGLRLVVAVSLQERLPAVGEKVKLYTHLYWRDDGPQLFGFADIAEVELFTRLISVSGIGPKVALSILGYASPAKVLTWLIYEDYASLRKIPGIGLKTAQRLVLELREKAASLVGDSDIGSSIITKGAVDTPARQALEALVSLGFDSSAAARVLAEAAAVNPSATLEQLITEGLKRSV